MNDSFVARLKTIIGHYELSPSTFADKIGVQRSSVSHLLNGRNRPSLDFVMKVIKTFPEVNLYWLLNGKGGFPDPTPKENANPKTSTSTPSNKITLADTEKRPTKIVVFYNDGTFESFEPKK
ncbi:helix-turn-helix transcriptional regulator [Allomuricauda sp. SCSIO 65647]|uniref:helix-turn-helix transcriptional regulator n=1 Tax=Allomuricauda sp. SCSIO 65647 TaxID=2908843 RepID=UPI0028BE1F75|nr:helix-turn-helix transcriptional regulator [Muricauda sp. SCSIO 65647]